MTLTIAGAAIITIAGGYGQPLSTREKGTLAGAIGAGGGALVGAAVGPPLAGAAIGGVVAAGTGMAIGNSMQTTKIVSGTANSHSFRARMAPIALDRTDCDRCGREVETDCFPN